MEKCSKMGYTMDREINQWSVYLAVKYKLLDKTETISLKRIRRAWLFYLNLAHNFIKDRDLFPYPEYSYVILKVL